MHVLITGGTGFIGSRLALRLLDSGARVRVLARRNNTGEAETAAALVARGVELVDASVTDPADLPAALAGVDWVFHLAAAQHEANVPDAYFRAINVEGTRNLLTAAQGAGVRRFVHGSTIGVFGWTPPHPVSEDSRLEPQNIYGVTKLEAEGVVRSVHANLPWVIARISETYGPGDRRLLKLFKSAARGLLLQIGPGENLHHLVFIDDLIDGLLLAAERPQAVHSTLLLAGPRPVSTREMLDAIARSLPDRRVRKLRVPLAPLMALAAGLEWGLRPLGIQPPLHRRRMDFFRKSFAFSNREARERLGYDPKVDVAQGMADTARWYHDEGWIDA
jgi:dihydroflavonol-4-reductase